MKFDTEDQVLFQCVFSISSSFLLNGHSIFRWSYIQSMNVTRSRVALVADMDRLWAIGGYDGMKNLSTVGVDNFPIFSQFNNFILFFRLKCTTQKQILGHLLQVWSLMREGWVLGSYPWCRSYHGV